MPDPAVPARMKVRFPLSKYLKDVYITRATQSVLFINKLFCIKAKQNKLKNFCTYRIVIDYSMSIRIRLLLLFNFINTLRCDINRIQFLMVYALPIFNSVRQCLIRKFNNKIKNKIARHIFPGVAGSASYTVMATDYSTYAAIFTCQKLAFAHRRSATILSRTKELDRIYVDKVRCVIDHSVFFIAWQLGCCVFIIIDNTSQCDSLKSL